MPPRRDTLCFIVQPPRILLGMKKRGFGEGNWNGFGGKVEPGEAVEAAARREVLEECGVVVSELEHVGELSFRFEHLPLELAVAVFRTNKFTGDPIETDEMRPQWFSVSELPTLQMWADDRYWMPWLLAGKKFKGSFLFNSLNQVVENQVEEVSNL